ncbi:MAG TPA: nuclease-related domain-containing protein, partial [Chloroflexota bacterium]|nr:nuclease-related domain-containing protein [Chloroflexota bacterium]
MPTWDEGAPRVFTFPSHPEALLEQIERSNAAHRQAAQLWRRRVVRWASVWGLAVLAMYYLPGGLTATASFVATVAFLGAGFCGVCWLLALGGRPGTEGQADAALTGLEGERQVGHQLAAQLPGGAQGFTILNNLRLPGVAGDIDHVVVGPNGLFVLETKNVNGTVSVDAQGNWQRVKHGRRGGMYDARIENPGSQVRRNVHLMGTYLRKTQPQLCARVRLWIEPMIVFPQAELVVAPGATPALRLEEVVPAILRHQPARRLEPSDVEALVAALVAGHHAASQPPGVAPPSPAQAGGERGQALLETALIIPLLLVLALGVVGVGRIVSGHMGLTAAVREAARSAALAGDALEAKDRGERRGQEVAAGYRLDRTSLVLTVDAAGFGRGGQVQAVGQYRVTLGDLPLLGWVDVPLTRRHVERIDP